MDLGKIKVEEEEAPKSKEKSPNRSIVILNSLQYLF